MDEEDSIPGGLMDETCSAQLTVVSVVTEPEPEVPRGPTFARKENWNIRFGFGRKWSVGGTPLLDFISIASYLSGAKKEDCFARW